jgi:predicted nucleotidyltransferase
MLKGVLAQFPTLLLAQVFGSVAQGCERAGSDLDIAVAARQPLALVEKMDVLAALAEQTGRPVDLIDLNGVTEPVFGQIVQHVRRILGSDGATKALPNVPDRAKALASSSSGRSGIHVQRS